MMKSKWFTVIYYKQFKFVIKRQKPRCVRHQQAVTAVRDNDSPARYTTDTIVVPRIVEMPEQRVVICGP